VIKYYIQKLGTSDKEKMYFIKDDNNGFTSDPDKAKQFTAKAGYMYLRNNDGFIAWEKFYIDSIKVSSVNPAQAEIRAAYNV